MAESSWAPTPAAPTIETMQKLVAGYCLMPDDDEALETALAGINLAIDRINSRKWNWALVDEDIQFDSAVIDYPLSSNFKKPQKFMICDVDGNTKDRLAYKMWPVFVDEHRDSSRSGTPCVYSCANVKEYGTLSLDCYPSTDFIAKYPTGRIYYYRKCQRANENGQPDWPSELTPYVMHYAEGFTASRYRRDASAMAYGLSNDCWRELVADDNDQQSDWE